MSQRRTKEDRAQILSEYLADRSQLRQTLKKHKVAKSTFYGWLRKYCKKCDQPVYTDFTAKNHLDLMNRLTKTEQMVEVLREVHCNCHSPLREKLEELEFLHGRYSVHVLCEALNVPRGTFYNHILRGKHGNTVQAQRREELKEAIKRVYDLGNRCFGVRKVTAILQKEGYHVSKDMVHKLMREMELFSFRTDAKREYEREMRRKRDHVEREFNPNRPNVIWVSDVTRFATRTASSIFAQSWISMLGESSDITWDTAIRRTSSRWPSRKPGRIAVRLSVSRSIPTVEATISRRRW